MKLFYRISSLSLSLLLFIHLLFTSSNSFSQIPTEQDCLGAIPICDFIWTTASSTLGSGNYLNEVSPGTCLVSGELNSTWFTFTVISSGDLAFVITPIDLTADYDWALYNLTNASCEEIPTNGSLMASCNSSEYGVTGISSDGIGNWNGPGPTLAFNYLLPVIAGETYALNIHNWSTSNGGYSIDFSTATATIFDTVPPTLQIVSPIGCDPTSLTFTFSENVLCSTVQAGDFSLSGPGGPFVISSVSGAACASGGVQEKTFTINFTPALENAATYTFGLTGNADYVTDLCGNVADTSSIQFTAPGPLIEIDSIHQPICSANSGAIYVSGNSGNEPYSYSLNSGTSQSSGAFEGLSTGAYLMTVKDSTGCTDTATVILVPGPGGVSAGILSSTNLKCPNECTGSITATGTGGTSPYTYSWSNGGPPVSTINNLCAGFYTATISDAAGCFDTASIQLQQPDTFSITTQQLMQPSCNGYADGQITVSVTGGTPGYTYQWSPSGGTGLTSTAIAAGLYTFTIVDANQCVFNYSIALPQPAVVSISPPVDTTICVGTTGNLFAQVGGGTAPYAVTWEDNFTGNPFPINPTSDASYTAVATDSHGCFSEPQLFSVIVDQVPVFELGNDSLLCIGDSLQLFAAFPGAQYSWQDGSTDDNFTIHVPGIYWVNVYNSCFTTSDTLNADYTDCSACVHYPSGFSPDGNQQNDLFRPVITCPVSDYNMKIFNRWGQLIFETSNVNESWNGEYKNQPADVGVYVWMVDYTGLRRATYFTEKLSGNITLLR
ncbi:MAG: gliding motility-associated C-terminal domain-containing protein [Chitinophagaceae bacterium]|nr:gliding motility-associated C-terminal domain-containing protein [Chitinophagaceae bacterium]